MFHRYFDSLGVEPDEWALAVRVQPCFMECISCCDSQSQNGIGVQYMQLYSTLP